MCILYGNVVLRIACTVRRIYTLYLHAIRKTTLPYKMHRYLYTTTLSN